MVKRILSLVLVACVIGLVGTMAYGAEKGDKATLTRRLGAGGYGTVAIQDTGGFDTGWGGGGYLKYMPLDYLALETSYDVQSWDYSSSVSGTTGTLTGDIIVMPWSFTALLTYPFLEGKLYPYAGGGLTILFNSGDVTGTLSPGGAAKIEWDNAIGGHVSGGFDWAITENLVLNFDVKYTWADPDASTSVQTGTLSWSGDFDNLTMRTGLAYYF